MGLSVKRNILMSKVFSPDWFIAERWKSIARQRLARLRGVLLPFLG
jgi:hypothetical protein